MRPPASCPLLVPGVITRRFLVVVLLAGVASFLLLGVTGAMIPNPVFGRQIPPEPFAYAIWIASSPLMGLVLATYLVRPAAVMVPFAPITLAPAAGADGRPAAPGPGPGSSRDVVADQRTSLLGYAGSIGAFLAIGCPVCNKVALVLLGTGGAMSIWAPIQPLLGAASLVLLAATAAWRMRLRARGGACVVRPG